MDKARVTSKGQVTIPQAIRRWLGVERGDELLFSREGETVRIQVLKRRRLTELYGALPATRPYPGVDAIRQETGGELGRELAQPRR